MVHEGFDNPPRSLEGWDGGIGWAGPYEEVGGRPAGEVVTPVHGDEFGAGNFARFTRDAYHFRSIDILGIRAERINERGTLGVPGDSLWLSVFIQAEEPVLPPFFGISLFEDGEEKLFLGRGTRETGGWKIQTAHQNALSGDYHEPHWIVLRIDFNHDGSNDAKRDRVLMFLNPDPEGSEPRPQDAAGEIRRSPDALSFNRVRFVGNGNGFRMNELRIGTTFSSVSPVTEVGTVVATQ